MLTKWFVIALVGFGCLTLILTPWAMLYEDLTKETTSEPANPIGTVVCAGICLFEAAAAIDWLVGWS